MNGIVQSLSDSEIEILKRIRKGQTSIEISRARNCSVRTVEKHRSNIIKKLGIATSQNALIIWLLNNPYYFK